MFSCTEVDAEGRNHAGRKSKRGKGAAACACCQALSGIVREPQKTRRKKSRRRERNQDQNSNGKQSATLLEKILGFARKEKPQLKSAETAATAATAETAAASADGTGEAIDTDGIPPVELPKPKRIWHGLDGMAVTVFGIGAPAAMIAFSMASMPKRVTLMLLNHPVETAAEILLLALIPYANYFVWNAISHNRVKFSRAGATALGAAIAASIITAGVCVAAIFASSSQFANAVGTDFSTGFSWIAFLSLFAAASSAYVAFRVRQTFDLPSARKQIVVCSALGAVMAALIFVGAEAKPWITRIAERMAVSTNANESGRGFALLRQLNPERDLRMECSDARAAGLAGLFLPLKISSQHDLYFRLTGKPYSFREFANKDLSSLPDEYLSANVVGERIEGLTLARSTMIGAVHPNTLTATVDWTFVFKNDTQAPQQMRTELGLPPGAVVKGLTVWTKGEARDAVFMPTETTNDTVYGGNGDPYAPAFATDLGHGRVLVNAYPIPQDEQAKVRVTMVVPLNPDATKSASLLLPKFIATNFDLSGDQVIRLHSSRPMSAGIKTLVPDRTRDGEYVLAGNVTGEDLQSSRLLIEAERPTEIKPVFIFDKIATKVARDNQKRQEEIRQQKERAEREERRAREEEGGDQQVVVWIDGSKGIKGQLDQVRNSVARKLRIHPPAKRIVKMLENRYVTEKTEQLSAPAPKMLTIVVDGSATVGAYAKQIAETLSKLPKDIPAVLMVASQEEQRLAKPTELAEAIKLLPNCKFIGGQDNLKTIVNAAELAGDTKGGAVLWIHGPQPALNHSIYIMAPYANIPGFYELPVGSGDTTDTVEYFRNHSEIGPFVQIARTADHEADDLRAFFKKWEPKNTAFVAKLQLVNEKPKNGVEASPEEASELLTLRAAQATDALIKQKRRNAARSIATSYGFVSPVSVGSILEYAPKNAFADQTVEAVQTENGEIVDQSAPQVQGATNGTIGPQGSDVTVMSGVNTAGTVRVNNLANLEALLNIFANLGEIACVLGGVILVLHGIARSNVLVEIMGQEFELGSGRRISIGVFLILLGVALPGTINWFVASARDANLFS